MTAEQMKYEFEVGYDRITNFDAPGYEPKEISTFLTKSQEELVLDIYNDNSLKEFNKKHLSILKTYTDVENTDPEFNPSGSSPNIYPNASFVEVPTNSMLVIGERADLTGSTTGHVYFAETFINVKVIPIDDDFYNSNIENPFKKPNEKRVWRMDYGENDSGWYSRLLYIYSPDYILKRVRINFYRKPQPIIIQDDNYSAGDGQIDGVAWTAHGSGQLSLDSELDPIVHREIVDRAVKLAYAALQDEKGFQISSAQEQQK